MGNTARQLPSAPLCSNNQQVIHPGAWKRVAGEGMPKWGAPAKRGKLAVKFEIEFPKSLTEDQRNDIRAAAWKYR